VGNGAKHKPGVSVAENPSVLSLRRSDFDPIGGVRLSDGTKTRRYRKDLIRVGDFYHSGLDLSFSVDLARLNGWAETFEKMRANGVRVPIPAGHTDNPEANRGYVEDIYVEGGTLYMVAELIGDDALALADRAEVSVLIEPLFTDGKGVEYRDAITHVAIVTNPVIPAQGRFIPIAASRSATVNARAFALAEQGGTKMEAMKRVAEALGVSVAEGMDEAGLVEAVLAAVAAMKTEMSADKDKYEEEIAASRRASAPVEIDADTRAVLGETAQAKLDLALSKGCILPVVRDRLWKLLGDKPVALSRTAANKAGLGEVSLLSEIAAILAENDPVKIGEQTKAQTVALSRNVPGDNGPKPLTADRTKQLVDESVARLGLKSK
jgi:hypothetical protein